MTTPAHHAMCSVPLAVEDVTFELALMLLVPCALLELTMSVDVSYLALLVLSCSRESKKYVEKAIADLAS
jgi:hypothetical protein